MLTETAQVLALEGDQVRVSTVRQSGCSGCSSRNGCGQRLLAEIGQGKRFELLVHNPERLTLAPGDQVELGVDEQRFLQASLRVYLLPLLLLALAAVLAKLSGGSEPQVIGAALVGLVSGFGWLAYWSRSSRQQCRYQPRIIGRLGASSPVNVSVNVVQG